MIILYLYAEVMGYTMATIRALIERGAEVHVVHWDHKKLTPYQPRPCQNLYLYKRSEMNVDEIQHLAERLSPSITVVSGWQDKGYMQIAKRLRSRGKIVVTGFDGQWQGTFRQHFASWLGCLGYFSQYFSHAWVSGSYQFEYARRLGFEKKNIIYDLYTADLSLFQQAYKDSLQRKRHSYPHRFLFVGRYEPIKGLDILLNAWNSLGDNTRDWQLHLVGNGSMKTILQSTPDMVVKDFMQPELLMEEVANAGCFLLPSLHEPWGVVVHEFAAAGMPLIVTEVVGAACTFLISGLNGYTFKTNDAQALAKRMRQIIDSPDEVILFMAEISHHLSNRISPQTSASNLLSVIDFSPKILLSAFCQ